MADTLIREVALDHHRPIRLLADLTGRPRATARSWATGHHRPPLPIVKTLLEVLRKLQAERSGVAPLEERQALSGLAYELEDMIGKRSYEIRHLTGFNEIKERDGPGSIPRDGRNWWGRPKRIKATTEPVNGAGTSRPGRGRGLVMISKPLPRFVVAKTLTSGAIAFYFNVPSLYRKLGCTISNEPLGADYTVACGENGEGGRAAALNDLFDEWNTKRKGGQVTAGRVAAYGTVDWLFREYKQSKAYLEKVSPRSQPDYERTMLLVTDIVTKKGDRIGDRRIRAITPVSADKIYDIICHGPRGLRPRQGEKAVALCRRAWRVVHRLHPTLFDRDVPNPWEGVTKHRRTKGEKSAATRDQVYRFAWGCIEHGQQEAAAAAVICFEWLQRPENVLAGYLRWTDYRSKEWPNAIKIEHHKTGAVVWHPLEEETEAGLVRFYEDAEAVLAKLPRRGVPMILRQVRGGITKPFSFSAMQKIVHTMRDKLGLPPTFTLDACRHGGMTELEEAELTDGQGRALSAHKSQQAYAGYAKRTIKRALAATRRRHAHALANAARTNIQNEPQNDIQNANRTEIKNATK